MTASDKNPLPPVSEDVPMTESAETPEEAAAAANIEQLGASMDQEMSGAKDVMVIDDNDEDEAALKMELEELLDGEEIDATNAENVDNEDDANVDTSAFTLKQHNDPVLNVKLTRDGGKLACAGQDDKMTLWNVFDLQSLKASPENGAYASCEGHTDSVVDCQYNHNDTLVASAGYDSQVIVWDVATGEQKVVLDGPGKEIEWLRWHPKGNVIFAGSADNTAWLWNVDDGTCMNVFSGHADAVNTGLFICNGKLLATGSADESVIIWDVRSARTLHKFSHLGCPVVCMAAERSKGDTFAIGTANGGVHVLHYDKEKGEGKKIAALKKHEDSCEAIAWSYGAPNNDAGAVLATGGLDGTVHLYETKNFSLKTTIKAHDEGITQIMWVPSAKNDRFLLTASLDFTCKLWDVRSGECVKVFNGHSEPVLSVDCHFDESDNDLTVVTSSDDHTVKVWDFKLKW